VAAHCDARSFLRPWLWQCCDHLRLLIVSHATHVNLASWSISSTHRAFGKVQKYSPARKPRQGQEWTERGQVRPVLRTTIGIHPEELGRDGDWAQVHGEFLEKQIDRAVMGESIDQLCTVNKVAELLSVEEAFVTNAAGARQAQAGQTGGDDDENPGEQPEKVYLQAAEGGESGCQASFHTGRFIKPLSAIAEPGRPGGIQFRSMTGKVGAVRRRVGVDSRPRLRDRKRNRPAIMDQPVVPMRARAQI
jgi:hypothetical protein